MIDRNHKLPVKRQCELLGVARSTAYYRPEAVSQGDLEAMRRIDELHLRYPRDGSGFSDTEIIDSLASNQEEQDDEQEKTTAETDGEV